MGNKSIQRHGGENMIGFCQKVCKMGCYFEWWWRVKGLEGGTPCVRLPQNNFAVSVHGK